MRKVISRVIFLGLCYMESFAGPGFSKPLREEENVTSVAVSVPARGQRENWKPSLEEGSILKRVIIFLEFSDLLCLEFASHKIKDNKDLWSFYLRHQGVDWNKELKLWKKIIVSEQRMKEIAYKNPLRLSIKDQTLVNIAASLGHSVAFHIMRNYYSKPKPMVYTYSDSDPSLKFIRRYLREQE